MTYLIATWITLEVRAAKVTTLFTLNTIVTLMFLFEHFFFFGVEYRGYLIFLLEKESPELSFR